MLDVFAHLGLHRGQYRLPPTLTRLGEPIVVPLPGGAQFHESILRQRLKFLIHRFVEGSIVVRLEVEVGSAYLPWDLAIYEEENLLNLHGAMRSTTGWSEGGQHHL